MTLSQAKAGDCIQCSSHTAIFFRYLCCMFETISNRNGKCKVFNLGVSYMNIKCIHITNYTLNYYIPVPYLNLYFNLLHIQTTHNKITMCYANDAKQKPVL